MLRHASGEAIVVHKEVWSLVGIGIAAVIALVIFVHSVLEESVASRVVRSACIPPSTASAAVCFSLADTLSHDGTTAVAVSPNGQLLASSPRKTIQLWNLKTGTLQRSLQGHADRITAIAFSPDGSLLASGSLDQTIKLWDLKTGKLVGTLKSGRVTNLKFSPTGQLLAAGSRILHWTDGVVSQEGVQLWDVATQQVRDRLGSTSITALAFSPDGDWLAAGHTHAQVWGLTTGKQRYQLINTGDLTDLLFSRDGQTLISGSYRIKLWQANSGTLLDTIASGASDLALNPEGTVLAAAYGGTINLWQLETGRLLGTVRGSWYSGLLIDFALNGRMLVGGSSDGLRIWRGVTSKVRSQALPPVLARSGLPNAFPVQDRGSGKQHSTSIADLTTAQALP